MDLVTTMRTLSWVDTTGTCGDDGGVRFLDAYFASGFGSGGHALDDSSYC